MPIDPAINPNDLFQPNTPVAEIVLGLILGLMGWPLYAGIVRLTGALAGMAGGIALILIADEIQPLEAWLIPSLVVAAVIGTLLGIWLIRNLEMVTWLLMGASLGILSVWTVHRRLIDLGVGEWSPVAQAALWVGSAFLIGALTVWLRRWLVMLATAGLGAALLAPHLTPLGPPALAWWCAGTVGFFAVQTGVHRVVGLADRDDEYDDDEED